MAHSEFDDLPLRETLIFFMALAGGERHRAASAQRLLVGASRWLQSLALEILQSEDQPGVQRDQEIWSMVSCCNYIDGLIVFKLWFQSSKSKNG
jgi:hypothetical protein